MKKLRKIFIQKSDLTLKEITKKAIYTVIFAVLAFLIVLTILIIGGEKW